MTGSAAREREEGARNPKARNFSLVSLLDLVIIFVFEMNECEIKRDISSVCLWHFECSASRGDRVASCLIVPLDLFDGFDEIESNERRILGKFTSFAAAVRPTIETRNSYHFESDAVFCVSMLGDWFPLEMDFLHNEIVFYGKRTSGATKA